MPLNICEHAGCTGQSQKQLLCFRAALDGGHDAVQLKYVALSRLDEVVGQYSQKLSKSPVLLGAALLQAGLQLENRDMYSAAHKTCYSRVINLHLFSVQEDSQRLDGTSYHVQACIKAAQCLAHHQLQEDQQLRRTASVVVMCKCLGVCRLLIWRTCARNSLRLSECLHTNALHAAP